MRRTFLTITNILAVGFLVTFASCSESVEDFGHSEMSFSDHLRSYSEALQIAQQGISMLEGNSSTRSKDGMHRKIDKNGFKCIISQQTRSGRIDTLLYVVNFEDNNGFALVSARRNVDGLLAVTEKGNYEPNSVCPNDGLNTFIELAELYAVEGPLTPTRPHPLVVSRTYHGPLLHVQWGQEWPEGYYCPNGICGCANTAIAQALSYYEHPSVISLTYPNADVSYQQLEWTELKKHVCSNSPNGCFDSLIPGYVCTAQYETHFALARLCRQLGYLASSNYYGSGGTGTTISGIVTMLPEIGYISSDVEFYSIGKVKNTINSNHVLCMCGVDASANNVGHMWVADGYCEEVVLIPGIGIDGADVYTQNCYNHINWGWCGVDNGYFLDDVWDTGCSEPLDGIVMSDSYNFNFCTQCFAIYPNV